MQMSNLKLKFLKINVYFAFHLQKKYHSFPHMQNAIYLTTS